MNDATMLVTVRRAAEAWLADPAIDEADKVEIRRLLDAGDWRELTDRFHRDLEFGTGGLRGIMGAGLNRMNVYTVGAAAQGLAAVIVRQGDAARRAGCAIAYDCRHNSEAFARRVACVMAGNGITAHLFEALRPTPQLSFAVRHLGCTAGVVITASHNPPEYNGFKAYWNDGAQVTPPIDGEIIDEVRRVGAFSNVKSSDFESAKSTGLIRMIGRALDEAFLDCVLASCLNPDACRAFGPRIGIVFTPLHGTGATLIPEALSRRGFTRVHLVNEQMKPDGAFPTVKSPNPEEPAAFEMALAVARRENAELVLATDPDADRMGIAVREAGGDYRLLTGNHIAALLTWYICEQLRRSGKLPSNGVVLSTIVSGDLMKVIARSYGVQVVETLTGFKWIAEAIRKDEQAGEPGKPARQFLFGAEESYGYMPCTFTRDKDAVTAAAMLAELAAVLAKESKTLAGLLDELFLTHGYFAEGAKSITMPGADGAARITALMASLRNAPPKQIAGRPVISIGDVNSGEMRDSNGNVIGRYDLPPSDVLVFTLDDGTKVIARPSGTEPKIKFYILARIDSRDLAAARIAANDRIAAIAKEMEQFASSVK